VTVASFVTCRTQTMVHPHPTDQNRFNDCRTDRPPGIRDGSITSCRCGAVKIRWLPAIGEPD
jgi:hypothetical protein